MGEEKIALRKQAIQRFLNGESKSSIAMQLGKSRLWVMRWVGRYRPDDPEGSLCDRGSAPRKPHRGWPEEVRQMVLRSREARAAGQPPGHPYALIGAAAIHFELYALGLSAVPPIRTIHARLKQAGKVSKDPPEEIEEKPGKPYPALESQEINDLHELDLKGPFYLTGSPQKYYLGALARLALLDVANHPQPAAFAHVPVDQLGQRPIHAHAHPIHRCRSNHAFDHHVQAQILDIFRVQLVIDIRLLRPMYIPPPTTFPSFSATNPSHLIPINAVNNR